MKIFNVIILNNMHCIIIIIIIIYVLLQFTLDFMLCVSIM
jgi:hypothetical protein